MPRLPGSALPIPLGSLRRGNEVMPGDDEPATVEAVVVSPAGSIRPGESSEVPEQAGVPGELVPAPRRFAGGLARRVRGPRPSAVARNVFVVHGRDREVLEAMYDFLRALDLRPLEWEMLVTATGSATPFLGEVFAEAFRIGQATLVLLTPDDVVSLHPALLDGSEADFEAVPCGQPRPNVLLELGMALIAAPMRTIILKIGNIRPIADLAGLNTIQFDGSPDALGKLVRRLNIAGCAVDESGIDWRRTSRFACLEAYSRRPPTLAVG